MNILRLIVPVLPWCGDPGAMRSRRAPRGAGPGNRCLTAGRGSTVQGSCPGRKSRQEPARRAGRILKRLRRYAAEPIHRLVARRCPPPGGAGRRGKVPSFALVLSFRAECALDPLPPAPPGGGQRFALSSLRAEYPLTHPRRCRLGSLRFARGCWVRWSSALQLRGTPQRAGARIAGVRQEPAWSDRRRSSLVPRDTGRRCRGEPSVASRRQASVPPEPAAVRCHRKAGRGFHPLPGPPPPSLRSGQGRKGLKASREPLRGTSVARGRRRGHSAESYPARL